MALRDFLSAVAVMLLATSGATAAERVVVVRDPPAVRGGDIAAERVRAMVVAGMCALTGAETDAAAWRQFASSNDVVGIKMNPVGNPLANTSSELMLEVIDGLN